MSGVREVQLTDSLLSCTDVFKSYRSNDAEVEVIRGVSLDARKREFTVLMGSSGSGKSTLLYLLSGLETVSSGDIWLNGQKISSSTEKELSLLRRNSMGFVFQAFNLVPNLTLLENVMVAGYLGTSSKSQVKEKSRELLGKLGLEKISHRLPAEVSGGEQQRAATARALVNDPQILFADEPTGALNSSAGQSVLELFASLADQNQSILMVTHDLRAACAGDRVIFMRDGRIHGEFRFAVERPLLKQREESLFAWLTEQGW
jgi:putative ABC transport system ATP-binding protein